MDWRFNLSPLKDAGQKTQGVAIVLDDLTEQKKLEGQRPDMKWDVHADKKARLIVLQVAYDKKNKQSGPVISTYTFLVEPIDLDHTRVHCHNVCRFRNVKTGEIGNPFLWVATPGYFDMAEKAIKERQVAR